MEEQIQDILSNYFMGLITAKEAVSQVAYIGLENPETFIRILETGADRHQVQ